jgi:hypothetical protein
LGIIGVDENGGIIINTQRSSEKLQQCDDLKERKKGDERRSTRCILKYFLFRHDTMVNDIINQLS